MQLKAIIDTGADISLVKKEVISYINTPIDSVNIHLADMQGLSIPCYGSVKLGLGFSKLRLRHIFIVVKDTMSFKEELLVGIDFLNKFEAEVNWEILSITIKGQSLQLQRENKCDNAEVQIIEESESEIKE